LICRHDKYADHFNNMEVEVKDNRMFVTAVIEGSDDEQKVTSNKSALEGGTDLVKSSPETLALSIAKEVATSTQPAEKLVLLKREGVGYNVLVDKYKINVQSPNVTDKLLSELDKIEEKKDKVASIVGPEPNAVITMKGATASVKKELVNLKAVRSVASAYKATNLESYLSAVSTPGMGSERVRILTLYLKTNYGTISTKVTINKGVEIEANKELSDWVDFLILLDNTRKVVNSEYIDRLAHVKLNGTKVKDNVTKVFNTNANIAEMRKIANLIQTTTAVGDQEKHKVVRYSHLGFKEVLRKNQKPSDKLVDSVFWSEVDRLTKILKHY